MKNRLSYSYSILRYVHDGATGEFVNIGVAIHCKDLDLFQVLCRQTLGRISEFFPDLNAKAFRTFTKTISARFGELSKAYADPDSQFTGTTNLESLLSSVLPKDDSALTWSSIEGGISSDPHKTLEDLYARYVNKYDHKTTTHKRTDEDVWRNFSRALENRHIAKFFVEKTISGKDDKVKFKSAWKNGVWHCVEPISFDLSAPETIREKAHRVLGQITSVADTSEHFKLYLVLATPSKPNLSSAFDQAVQILKKMQADKEIYTESETDELLTKLQTQIAAHEHIQF